MAYERFSLGSPSFLKPRRDDNIGASIFDEELFSPTTRPRIEGMRPQMDPNTFGKPFDPSVVKPEELATATPAKPSFYDEYSKIAGARPEQDRLRELVTAGAPKREDFKPNKLSRIGAVMGGFSAGWRDPSKGVELAQSILDRPYNEASAEYDKKLRSVGALAGIESDTIKDRLEGFKSGRQFEENTEEREQRRRTSEGNAWQWQTNESTGDLEAFNPVTNEKRNYGKMSRSAAEKLNDQKELEGEKSRLNILETEAKGKAALEKTRESIRARAGATGDQKIQLAMSRLWNLASVKPYDVNEYVSFNKETGMPEIGYKGGWTGMAPASANDLKIENEIRAALAIPESPEEIKKMQEWLAGGAGTETKPGETAKPAPAATNVDPAKEAEYKANATKVIEKWNTDHPDKKQPINDQTIAATIDKMKKQDGYVAPAATPTPTPTATPTPTPTPAGVPRVSAPSQVTPDIAAEYQDPTDAFGVNQVAPDTFNPPPSAVAVTPSVAPPIAPPIPPPAPPVLPAPNFNLPLNASPFAPPPSAPIVPNAPPPNAPPGFNLPINGNPFAPPPGPALSTGPTPPPGFNLPINENPFIPSGGGPIAPEEPPPNVRPVPNLNLPMGGPPPNMPGINLGVPPPRPAPPNLSLGRPSLPVGENVPLAPRPKAGVSPFFSGEPTVPDLNRPTPPLNMYYPVLGSTNVKYIGNPPARSAPYTNYDDLLKEKASKYKIPESLIHAVVKQESEYLPNRTSPAGAQGLMQFMPAMQKSFGIKDPFDAEQSADAGAKFLAHLLKKYKGDVPSALAAYNRGETNFDKWLKQQPKGSTSIAGNPTETRRYISIILGDMKKYEEGTYNPVKRGRPRPVTEQRRHEE